MFKFVINLCYCFKLEIVVSQLYTFPQIHERTA